MDLEVLLLRTETDATEITHASLSNVLFSLLVPYIITLFLAFSLAFFILIWTVLLIIIGALAVVVCILGVFEIIEQHPHAPSKIGVLAFTTFAIAWFVSWRPLLFIFFSGF